MKIKIRENNCWHLIAAGILGIIIFIGVYGLEPLRYSGIGWTQRGYDNEDIVVHQAGWMYYRNSPWSFPLCKALFLGYPEGTSISYTDSIPVAALFFKLISPILPESFQYFGLYTCFCFVMQGIFASALLFFFTKNRLYSSLGSIFFTASSCFLERCFRHTALSSHWLLLASLLLYLYRKKKKESACRWHILWGILLCLSLGIHPYLFAMVFGVFFFSEIDAFSSPSKRRNTAAGFLLCIGSVIVFGWLIGLFGSGTAKQNEFGYYSLNLNALINPDSKFHNRWSAVVDGRSRYRLQGDGIYYFGLPLLIVFAVSTLIFIVFDKRTLKRLLKEYFQLLILLVCFWVFALSNAIAFDGQVLISIPLPKKLLELFSIFRTSERFFFIPYYCIILWTLTVVFKLLKDRRNVAVLLCLVTAVLQIAEIRPGLKDLHYNFETRKRELYLSKEWEALSEEYDTAVAFDPILDRQLTSFLGMKGFRTDLVVGAPIFRNAYWSSTRARRDELKDALADGREVLDPDTLYIIDDHTGKNCSFETPEQMGSYLQQVKTSYRGRAELLYLPVIDRHYWVLVPLK